MTVQLVVILLGIISSVTLLISALSVHRIRLLSFSILTGALVAVEYGLMSSWTGLVSVGIGLAWTIISVISVRYTSLNHPLFVPVFVLLQTIAFCYLTNWQELTALSFVPLIGGVGGVIGVYLKQVLHMKAIFIVCGAMWLGYEAATGIYGQMVGEAINLVANIVAFCALMTARKRGIPESMMQDLDTQFIETITSAISLPTHTKPLPVLNYDLYPAHTLRGSKKPIRGAHPQSVGYARLNAEYDRTRDHLREEFVRKFEQMDEQERARIEEPAGKRS